MGIVTSKNIQEAYNRQYTNSQNEWRELCARYKAKNILAVCSSLKSIGRVLEVGAGEGSILKHLDELGFGMELYALDIAESSVEAIRNRGIQRLKKVGQFDGYRLPYEDDFFEVVILSHVIEHVEFPRLLLREIRRVSQFLVIEIPCDFSWDVDEKVEHFHSYGHINIFLPSLLRFLLKSEGFRIISDTTTLMTKDVIEYSRYINGMEPRSLVSIFRLNIAVAFRNLAFMTYSRRRKELKGNAYTVLCGRGKNSLEIFEPVGSATKMPKV